MFVRECRDFNDTYYEPYNNVAWTSLGERFQTPAPEEPVAQRIAAVKTQFRPTDKLLLLSPFDHLIASYINPERYCGHFEMLTNLVTEGNVATVLNCARNSPNVLIVYDVATETGCPLGIQSDFIDLPSCDGKKRVKDTVKAIMDVLKPDAELVAVDGDLRFYRMKPKQLSQDVRE